MPTATEIDTAILAATDQVFRKVARIIHNAAGALQRDGLTSGRIEEEILVARVQALVAGGRI